MALAAEVESGLPPKVEIAGRHASITSGRPTTPPIASPLPMPLAKVIMSGSTRGPGTPRSVPGAAPAGLHLVGHEQPAVLGHHLGQRTE